MAYDNFTASPATKNLRDSFFTFDYVLETIAGGLYKYHTPVIVIFGLIGNILSCIVFGTSKLRMYTARIYLSILALSDSLFLLGLLPPWLSALQVTTLFHRQLYCQIFVYISYVSSCLSTLLVVAFTVERFVAVMYPLHRYFMCTVTRAKLLVIVLIICAMLLNFPLIIFASPSVNDCNINYAYMVPAAQFNVADTIISFTLPLAVILVLNSLITLKLYRARQERRELQAQQATENESCGSRGYSWCRACLPPPPPPPRAQHRITRMLLIVSTVFVGLNVPAYTMRVLAYANDMSTAEYTGRLAALQQITLVLFNTNFGINFILYCLTGQNFRRALCQALPCFRAGHVHRRANALRLTARNEGNAERANNVTSSRDEELVREFNRNLEILNGYIERLAPLPSRPTTPWYQCW